MMSSLARRQRHRLMRRDRNGLDRAHLHDAVVAGGFMHLGCGGDRCADADKSIGLIGADQDDIRGAGGAAAPADARAQAACTVTPLPSRAGGPRRGTGEGHREARRQTGAKTIEGMEANLPAEIDLPPSTIGQPP